MHTGGVRSNIGPPQAIFKTLVNKNAINPEIGGPPWQFFLKALTPTLGIWTKTSGTPSPGFSPGVHPCAKPIQPSFNYNKAKYSI